MSAAALRSERRFHLAASYSQLCTLPRHPTTGYLRTVATFDFIVDFRNPFKSWHTSSAAVYPPSDPPYIRWTGGISQPSVDSKGNLYFFFQEGKYYRRFADILVRCVVVWNEFPSPRRCLAAALHSCLL